MNRNNPKRGADAPESPGTASPDAERFPPDPPEVSEANDEEAFETDVDDGDVDDNSLEDENQGAN